MTETELYLFFQNDVSDKRCYQVKVDLVIVHHFQGVDGTCRIPAGVQSTRTESLPTQSRAHTPAVGLCNHTALWPTTPQLARVHAATGLQGALRI